LEESFARNYLVILYDITERKMMEESLRFRQFSLDHAGEEVFWIGKDAHIVDANEPACRKLGYTHEELCGLTVANVDAYFPIEKWPEHWQELKNNKTLRFESFHKCRDGKIFPTEIVANYFEYEGLEYNCALVRDISERKAFEQALKEKTDYLNTILNSEPECVKVVGPDGELIEMNPAGLKLLEVDSVEEVQKFGLVNFILPEYRPLFHQLHHEIFQGKTASLELMIEGKRGGRYWLDTHAAPLFDENGKVKSLVGVTRDITERMNLLRELEYQAKKDPLTGLSNRRQFLELAELELSRVQRYGSPLSMLMMDIDLFKSINDTYGHKAGDLVLQRLASICGEALREVDIMGRMGGEEFAILLPETLGLRALEVAERMRHELENTRVLLDWENIQLQFTVSIGVATMGNAKATVDNMLLDADFALFQAKNSGRNKVVVFSDTALTGNEFD
jgi:diguanylate cyclase (GGDEF)-like protein/PAS domain S-box-containing protein